MAHLDIWKVSCAKSNREFTQYINNDGKNSAKNHLLDLTKAKYTLIEKFVYDTAMFHFKRLNITNTDGYYVEFWFKPKSRNQSKLRVDCDEALKNEFVYKYPLLSSITYLNDNVETPTIITGIDMDCYKYKKFEKQKEIILSMPVSNKQITFDGHFFHGNVALTDNYDDEKERYIIAINLWNVQPTDVSYYSMDDEHIDRDECVVSISACNNICNISVSSEIINYSFFNDILYNNRTDTCYKLKQFIDSNVSDDIHTFKITIDETIKRDELTSILKTKYGDVIEDFNSIMDETHEIKYNRFLQRFTYNQVYSADMCQYIINECEQYAKHNGGWTKTRHANYPTTDLPVDNVRPIVGLILQSLGTIMNKIQSSYNLDNKVSINVRDLFVVKYSHDAQNFMDMHKDGSVLSFSILLNPAFEFKGGGTYFDDGLTVFLNQGDMIIHSGKIKHVGLEGVRYLLVGFVDLQFV